MWSIQKPEGEVDQDQAGTGGGGAASYSSSSSSLIDYLRETKTQLEDQKRSKRAQYEKEIRALQDQLLQFREPYHANQRKRTQLEIDRVMKLVENLDHASDSQWHLMEQHGQRFSQLFEHEQLLESIEQLYGASAGGGGAGPAGTSPRYSNMCLTRLQKRAPDVQIKAVPTCPRVECREQILTYDSIHSTLSCPKCGRTQLFMDATSNLTAYGDEVEITNFTYKKITHLKDHLMYAQGKESTRVPDDIILQICDALRTRFGFKSKEHIHLEDTHKAMKSLQLRKFYKNKVQIHSRITGIPPNRLTTDQETKLVHNFRQMQPFFEQGDGKSLPYRFCLHRLCEYQGLQEFQKMFPLPKNDKKLEVFDRKLETIIGALHWDRSKFFLSFQRKPAFKRPRQTRAGPAKPKAPRKKPAPKKKQDSEKKEAAALEDCLPEVVPCP